MNSEKKSVQHDQYLNLNYSYNMSIESAYVITLDGHSQSEKLSERCLESCRKQNMLAKKWFAFDGTNGEIKTPLHQQRNGYLKWIKKIDPYLSATEVACALSHFSLWCHCLEIDQPIVVLEHDALMIAPLMTHPVFCTIQYLGCREQVEQGWSVFPTPPHATNGNNFHFLCRAHAYSIDPAVAKLMVSYMIHHGIHESLDMMLRADLFPIIQLGLFAYDSPEGLTTITDRKKNPFGQER